MDFQPWEPPPPPPLDRNVSVMLSSLHTPPPVLPRLSPPYREGRHPPACRSPQCHLLCPPSLQSCNVTYFSAHLPTPALMHLAKVRAGQQGKKKSIFRNWEMSLTVAKLFQLFQHIDVTQSNVPACLHQRALTEEGQGLSESRKNKTLEGNSSREIVKQTMLGLTCSRCILY